jgi:hypothetical protein
MKWLILLVALTACSTANDNRTAAVKFYDNAAINYLVLTHAGR